MSERVGEWVSGRVREREGRAFLITDAHGFEQEETESWAEKGTRLFTEANEGNEEEPKFGAKRRGTRQIPLSFPSASALAFDGGPLKVYDAGQGTLKNERGPQRLRTYDSSVER